MRIVCLCGCLGIGIVRNVGISEAKSLTFVVLIIWERAKEGLFARAGNLAT
jgi:hypothetical protein